MRRCPLVVFFSVGALLIGHPKRAVTPAAFSKWDSLLSSRRRHTRSLCDWSSDVCSSDLIKKAEDRLLFKDAMRKIGLATPQSQLVNSVRGGLEFAERIGYPCILRPSFTMGGTGGEIGRAACRERV